MLLNALDHLAGSQAIGGGVLGHRGNVEQRSKQDGSE
jgi:hypothetical protein